MEANLLNAIKGTTRSQAIRSRVGKSLDFRNITKVKDMDKFVELVKTDLTVGNRPQKIGDIIVAKPGEKYFATMIFDEATKPEDGIAAMGILRGVVEDENGSIIEPKDVGEILAVFMGHLVTCKEQVDSPTEVERNSLGTLVPKTVYKFVLSK